MLFVVAYCVEWLCAGPGEDCTDENEHFLASEACFLIMYGYMHVHEYYIVNTVVSHIQHRHVYRNSRNFRVTYFRLFNFCCNLLFAVSRGYKYSL